VKKLVVEVVITAETGCLCSNDSIDKREEAGCSGTSLSVTKSRVLQFI
jgi:hypothetical protein